MIVDNFQLGEVRKCDGSMNIVLQYWQVATKISSYHVLLTKNMILTTLLRFNVWRHT